MKAVVDEGVPRLLIPELRECGCEVERFPNAWKGLKNGALLAELERAGFDCLITCDKNLEWQRDLRNRASGVVVLPFQKLEQLKSIVADIADAIKAVHLGEISHVIASGLEVKT